MSFRERIKEAFNEAHEIVRDLGAEVRHTVTHPGESFKISVYGAADIILKPIRLHALDMSDIKIFNGASNFDCWLESKLVPSSMRVEQPADRSSGPI
ncbi:MAG: hypothetical protein KA155_01480 [Alphaproteobacteria bacterium]|jgi:hypothetical protein|nr:hypothetical protein [Alphaproteobacteria bacterium]